MKLIKATKYSLSDLENVPYGVKYIAIVRDNPKKRFSNASVNIRTENNRFISHHFETIENPATLANLAIEEFNKGKLKPQDKESIVKGLDRFVENGIFETVRNASRHLEFIYYV